MPRTAGLANYVLTDMMSSLREVLLSDQGALLGLPYGYRAMHFVFNPAQADLPSYYSPRADRVAVSWETFLDEAERLSALDRDGDGIPDSAVCRGFGRRDNNLLNNWLLVSARRVPPQPTQPQLCVLNAHVPTPLRSRVAA